MIMLNYLLTCKTVECENFDVAIPLTTDAQLFLCGPCGNEIAVKEVVTDEPVAKATRAKK
jgi:hypothetical protein